MFSPERDKEGNPIIRLHAMPSPLNEYARLTKTHEFTIPGNSETSSDYILEAERLLDGIKYKISDLGFSDSITLQIVHPLAGVINEFGSEWPASKEETIRLFKAKLPAGLIIRVTYKNTTANPIDFIAGMFLYEVIG